MSRNADCECIKKRLEKAAKRVNTMPAADVAPVVRCKDCMHCGFCGDATNLQVMGFYGFCSRGERKEERTEVTAMRLIDADKLERQEYWGMNGV